MKNNEYKVFAAGKMETNKKEVGEVDKSLF